MCRETGEAGAESPSLHPELTAGSEPPPFSFAVLLLAGFEQCWGLCSPPLLEMGWKYLYGTVLGQERCLQPLAGAAGVRCEEERSRTSSVR